MQENGKDKRLEKQLDFIREIDKEKEIFRQTYLAGFRCLLRLKFLPQL